MSHSTATVLNPRSPFPYELSQCLGIEAFHNKSLHLASSKHLLPMLVPSPPMFSICRWSNLSCSMQDLGSTSLSEMGLSFPFLWFCTTQASKKKHSNNISVNVHRVALGYGLCCLHANSSLRFPCRRTSTWSGSTMWDLPSSRTSLMVFFPSEAWGHALGSGCQWLTDDTEHWSLRVNQVLEEAVLRLLHRHFRSLRREVLLHVAMQLVFSRWLLCTGCVPVLQNTCPCCASSRDASADVSFQVRHAGTRSMLASVAFALSWS